MRTLILASTSARRRELMNLLTQDFMCEGADIIEVSAGSALDTCVLNARAKCLSVESRFPGHTVIGCDTVVEIGGLVLGKPADATDAGKTLLLLSGREHSVCSGVCVAHRGIEHQFTCVTRVVFNEIPASEIDGYVMTDEPYDKAGAYAIQGWAAKYISEIHGDYYNVMGLPVSALYSLLRQLGAL